MAAWIVAAIPPAVIAALVYSWGVDLPYWDQWDLIPFHVVLREGGIQFGDLWRRFNEHRIFFPHLIMLGLGRVSGWNIRWELAANLLLAIGIFLATVRLWRRAAPPQALKEHGGLLLIASSLLIFNPSQWENWSWGVQINVLLNVCAVMWGSVLLAEDATRTVNLVLAAVCGFVATFSFGNGLLFWPLALLLVLRPPRARWRRTAAWLLLSTAVIALFFFGYGYSPGSFLFSGGWRPLKLLGGYVSIYLGGPVFYYHGYVAMYGGFVALVAFALTVVYLWWRRREAIRAALPWLVVAGYAILSASLTALGRLPVNLGQALSSRYVTISTLFWLGFLGLLASSFGARTSTARFRFSRQLRIAVVALMLSLLLAAGKGIDFFHQHYRIRATLREALRHDERVDLSPIYPDPRVVKERIPALQRYRLSLFRDAGGQAGSDL